MSVQPLAFVEIKSYHQAFDLEDFEIFYNNIKAADDVYMQWAAKAKK